MDYQVQLTRWLERAGEDPDLISELNEVKHDPKAVADRFYRDLEFGTGGLRGVIGAGTNRMNIYTVRRATQGLADYLNASSLPKAAAIAHDSRIKGDLFAREAARVLAANDVSRLRLVYTPLNGAGLECVKKLLNEMGVLLFDYLCRTRMECGTMPEHPVAVTTIVSTDMTTPIAEHYGVELRRTLTGFKYIGEQIGLLEAEQHKERYMFGFEESYGYLSGAHVRDKDAVNAVMLACECAAWYAERGQTLLDGINELYEQYGWFRDRLVTKAFEGQDGMAAMAHLMKALRNTPPCKIAG